MILITGANGWIGIELTSRVLKEGERVRAFCHKEDEKIIKLKRIYGEKLEIIYGDIQDINEYEVLLEGIDTVYHLAAKIKKNADSPEEENEIYNINVNASKILFERCIQYHVKKIIFVSTVAVYKTSKKLIDIYSKKEPTTIYGKTKLEAEQIGLELYRTQGLPIIIIEPSTVYGDNSQGSVGKMIERANRGNCIRIGKGNAKKTIIHIQDLISLMLAIAKDSNNIGKTIICGSETLTINQFNKILKENSKNKVRIICIPNVLAKIIKALPFNNRIKVTINQLTQNYEYKSEYLLNNAITFEDYVKKSLKG